MKSGTSSFRELFGDGHRVEIPVIQRDYAQGREDEHSTEVRRRFLDAVGAALSAGIHEGDALDLDFVYGRWKTTELTLEPLDGQQRLTTLFLLHWYVAGLDGTFDNFQSWIMLPNGGSRFTYRTRPAAREFFDALVGHAPPIGTIAAGSRALSNWVTDSVWFVRSWHRDPTVRGCLTMLDTIHERFATHAGIWPRLVSTQTPAIIFRLLLLENFNLSDDLYIKMNARGKALTPFEVFKAEIERFIGDEFGVDACPYAPTINWREHVSIQFDIAWTNFLWKQKPRESTIDIDRRFMHLSRSLAIVRCVNQSDEPRLPKQIEQLLTFSEPGLPFYAEIGCLDRPFVEQFVAILETLAKHDRAPYFLGRVDYMNEVALFRRVLLARGANQEDGLTLNDWIMFYAWCSFILRFPHNLSDDTVRSSFHDWIRVVRNLANNSDIDRNERLVAALRGRLSQHSGAEFLLRIADGALDEISGFNQQQQREERLKAQLILRSEGWRSLIERAETHPYLRGDIDFLLRFSNLFERSAQSPRCNWDDEEDSALQRSFAEWYDRACAIFPESATTWPVRFPAALLERALLATGDYLLPRGRNWSLLDDNDRDASWKRLLRADTRVVDREARRDVIRRVLGKIDSKDVVGSLQTIVTAGVQGDDTIPLPGFRSRLVAEPRLIEYCGQRMLRLEDNSAFLLSRTQRNGRHVDLYVYYLYLRINDRIPMMAPFDSVELIDQTGTYAPSRIVLRTTATVGTTITVEKQSSTMQLDLQLAGPDPELAARLTDWTTEGEGRLRRSVVPEVAERAILDVVATLGTLFPAIVAAKS